MKKVIIELSKEQGLQIKYEGTNPLEALGMLQLAIGAMITQEEDVIEDGDVQ